MASFLVACLYRRRRCADDYSQYVTSPTTYDCHSHTHKIQSDFSAENSGVGGSNSSTRSSGSTVFMFYITTLLVARVYFIAMKSSMLSEE